MSLVLAKLHALRHFDQKERQDERHLQVCLDACRGFIAQLLRQQSARAALWNCERLIEAHQRKPNARLAAQYDFNILAAVPVERIREASGDPALDPAVRGRARSKAMRAHRSSGRRSLGEGDSKTLCEVGGLLELYQIEECGGPPPIFVRM